MHHRQGTPTSLTFALLLVVAGTNNTIGQDDDNEALAQPRQSTQMITGAESAPMELVQVNPLAIGAAQPLGVWKPGDPMKPVNPRHHFEREGRVRRIPAPPKRRDSLMAFQTRASLFAAEPALGKPILNIDGQGFSGVNPPDTTGAVGEKFFVQALNDFNGTKYAVYNKADGTLAGGPFLLSSHLNGPIGKGDPVVLYDHLAKRWLITEFARVGNKLLVYISPTDDPLAAADQWNTYQFTTPQFPDYPKYGIWPNGYYVTSNEDDGPAVYALDRERMLAGQPARDAQRVVAGQLSGFGFQALTPCDLDGAPPADPSTFYFLRHHDDEVHNFDSRDATQDFLDMYEFRVDFDDKNNSTFNGPIEIPIAEIDSDLNGLLAFECFRQKGSTKKLDPLREVIMNRLQYRNFGTHETMVGSFVTDVDGNDHGGVRWFELRKTATQAWHVHQEGTYAPDGLDRWMSSIAMDGQGNIAMAYNVTSSMSFPSLRYTGRLASDPMGTMPQPERVLIEGSGANNEVRYGDYAHLSIDPVGDKRFWFTGEHNQTSEWSTRIGTFEFTTASPTPPGPAPGIAPAAGIAAEAAPSTMEQRISSLEKQMEQLKQALKGATR